MRTDLRYKLTLAAVFAAIPLVLFAMVLFVLATNSLWIALFPVYLFAGALIITFILSFVPFMKDNMWLSVTAVTLLAVLAGLILHMVV